MMRYDNTSPQYFVKKWRNVPQETIETLDDFLYWLEHDDESPSLEPEQIHDIELLIDLYLHRDQKKLEQGEREMLDAWIKAVNHE